MGAANPGKPTFMMAQSVAHIIEADRMSQLGVEQRADMAPSGELASLLIDPVFPGKLPHEMTWNQFANLGKNAETGRGGWSFHQVDPQWDQPPVTSFFGLPVGWL